MDTRAPDGYQFHITYHIPLPQMYHTGETHQSACYHITNTKNTNLSPPTA